MNFKEWTCLIVIFIISLAFRFVYPVATVEDTDEDMAITITLEGKKAQVLTFDDLPTIGDVLEQGNVENKYGFDESYILDDGDTLYLPTGSISLNKASKEQLMTLKGVGEKKAESIIEYRKEYGFKRIEDLMNISGIGEKTYEKLRDDLCL